MGQRFRKFVLAIGKYRQLGRYIHTAKFMKIFCLDLQISLYVFSKPLPTSPTKLKFEHNMDDVMTDNLLGPDDSPESTFHYGLWRMRRIGRVGTGRDGTWWPSGICLASLLERKKGIQGQAMFLGSVTKQHDIKAGPLGTHQQLDAKLSFVRVCLCLKRSFPC